jgi:hypothetical protein
MKNNIFNLLGSLIAFYIPVQIAYLTGSETVLKAVVLAFIIQWVCFVPAYLLQTEKFYDLTALKGKRMEPVFLAELAGSNLNGALIQRKRFRVL